MNLAVNSVLADEMNSVIEAFVSLSRLDEKIDRFSAGVIGNIENDRNAMPVDVFDKYKEIIVNYFDPLVLKENVRVVISERYDDKKMGKMIDFLKHPKVELMTQREESSKSLQAAQDMQDFFAGLQHSSPTEERKRLIEKIDSVKRSSSFVVDMQVELFKAITWGMRGLSPDNQRITEDQLNQMALDMKAKLDVHMEQQVWMSMLFSYKDMSDTELEEYILLHETVEGKLTVEFVQLVYSNVHEQSVVRLRGALGMVISARPKTS